MAVTLPQLVLIEDALVGRNFLTLSIEGDWIQPEASPRHGDYAMRISGTRGRADVLFADNGCSSRRGNKTANLGPAD